MTKYVALLRGINLGKNHRVSMTDLKVLAEDLGLQNVTTYLASGNLLFNTDNTPLVTQKVLDHEFAKRFGFNAPVMIQNLTEITRIIEQNPFALTSFDSNWTLFASILWEPLSPELQSSVEELSSPNEKFAVVNNTIYTLLLRSYFSESATGKSVLMKRFGIQMTARNWNTITKLAALLPV